MRQKRRYIFVRLHRTFESILSYYNDKSEPFKYIEGEKWFDTLDNGTIDSNGNLFIQGRQSNLIILDDGNNTAPEELEVMFEKYDIIGDIMVYEAHAELGNLIAAQAIIL